MYGFLRYWLNDWCNRSLGRIHLHFEEQLKDLSLELL